MKSVYIIDADGLLHLPDVAIIEVLVGINTIKKDNLASYTIEEGGGILNSCKRILASAVARAILRSRMASRCYKIRYLSLESSK